MAQLSTTQLERIKTALETLEELAGNTGVTIPNFLGKTYLDIDDQMIEFEYDSNSGQCVLSAVQ